jgi:hypothetical protein
VPLGYRVPFGFLAREGIRESKALGLRWRDVYLEHGVLTLDENKTDDPRSWVLSAGVVPALKRLRPKGRTVFAGVNVTGLARKLRADLKTAGVDRPVLFTTTPSRQALRVHDLRATFVTLNLAAGKSEAWSADRTGHRSSQMINQYRRRAREASELNLGELDRLDAALESAQPGGPFAGPDIGPNEAANDNKTEEIQGCPGRELNPRHEDFQSSALPTELPGRGHIEMTGFADRWTGDARSRRG